MNFDKNQSDRLIKGKKLAKWSCFLCLLLLTIHTRAQVVPTTAIKPPASNNSVNTTPSMYGSGVPVNFIRGWDVHKPMTDPISVMGDENNNDVTQSTQYNDGLGRSLQTVIRGMSPEEKDLIQPVLYDAFGRKQYEYLPYVSESNDGSFNTDPFNEQASFFAFHHSEEQFYYAHTQFDGSPLNRIAKSFAPGNSWEGSEVTSTTDRSSIEKGVSMQYLINNVNDIVRIWSIDFDPISDIANIPSSAQGQIYNPGQLFKTVTVDENNNATVEYQDVQGHLVLRKVQTGTVPSDFSGYTNFLCTFYVYDDLGRLRTIITPKAVTAITGSWVISPAIINELCFRYEYDTKNRVIARMSPGVGWNYIVYDRQDNPVYTQDANLRLQNNKWMGIRYDQFERPVQTGMLTGFSGSRNDLQIVLESSQTQTTVQTQGNGLLGVSNDLAISSREVGRPSYQALNKVVFEGGFSSEPQANITAEIITAPPSSTFTDVQVFDNDIVPGGATFTPLTLTYYDNYDWAPTNKNYSTGNNSKLDDVGSNPYPEALPAQKSVQVKNLETGSRVKVIEDPADLTKGNWLETVNFYDDKERVIQTQSDNYKGGTDVLTSRYNFSGILLSTYEVHNNSSANVANLRVKTLLEYDHAGRVTSVSKTINDDNSKKRVIAQYSYDDLGNVFNKKTGNKTNTKIPDYTSTLENDNYVYSLQGKLKGINWKQYTIPIIYGSGYPGTAPNIDRDADKWFAMDLSYDWGFSSNQYNGNISGMRWSTAGDLAERAYGYTYDQANQFKQADFKQRFAGNWQNEDPDEGDDFNIDYTVKNVSYDENGNLKTMQQYGLQNNHSPLLDDLQYTCFTNTNKLKTVTDNVPAVPGNGFGDFMQRSTAGAHYGYDANGNLVTDLNKRFNGTTGTDADAGVVSSGGGVLYNFLDQPYQLQVADDNNAVTTISYIYDAEGNKLEKKSVAPDGTTIITDLIGEFVYTNNLLQYFSHEEGRVRAKRDVNGAFVDYMYDYFVTDHLGNVRTILTDEVPDRQTYLATMEDASRSFEVALFGDKINTTYYPKPCGFDDYQCTVPAANGNQKVAKVNGTTEEGRVGPGVVMKIMAGDKFSASTFGWYKSGEVNNDADPTLGNIVVNLLSQLTPEINALGKGALGGSATGSLLQPSVQSFSDSHAPINGAPRAYLNYILLDEKSFKAVQNGFVALPQIGTGVSKQLLQLNNAGDDITLTHNGYLYVWVSNESKGNVYFDDIRIDYQQGPLLEENQYYPFGLQMAALSSRAYGTLFNKFQYQGSYSEYDEETGYDEFALRNYDPQLGRWTGVDPKDQYGSPYVGMGNNPVNGIDQDGGDFDFLYQFATTAIGAGIGYLSAPKDNKWPGTIAGAVVGAGIGLGTNGTTDGIKSAWIGAGAGFAAPYLWEEITGKHIDHKLLWGLGGAFIGAGVGYGIGESLADVKTAGYGSGSDNFFANTISFYKGLFGFPDVPTYIHDHYGNPAWSPKLWGDIHNIHINIPKVSFTFKKVSILEFVMKPRGYKHHPDPDDDSDDDLHYPRKREYLSDAGFVWRLMILFGNPVSWPIWYLLDNIYIPIPHFKHR